MTQEQENIPLRQFDSTRSSTTGHGSTRHEYYRLDPAAAAASAYPSAASATSAASAASASKSSSSSGGIYGLGTINAIGSLHIRTSSACMHNGQYRLACSVTLTFATPIRILLSLPPPFTKVRHYVQVAIYIPTAPASSRAIRTAGSR